MKVTNYNEQLDQIVQAELDRPRIYNTVESVRNWAQSKGFVIDDATLAAVDIRAWDDIINVSEEMLYRFPEIDTDRQKKFKEMFGEPITGNEQFLFEYHYEAGYWMGYGGNNLLFGRGFSDYEYTVRSFLNAQAEIYEFKPDGTKIYYNVQGDGTMKVLPRHEWGHVFFASIKDDIGWNGMENLKNKLKAAAYGKQGMSDYAKKDDDEFLAEGFADWSSGGTSDFALSFGEELRKFLGR